MITGVWSDHGCLLIMCVVNSRVLYVLCMCVIRSFVLSDHGSCMITGLVLITSCIIKSPNSFHLISLLISSHLASLLHFSSHQPHFFISRLINLTSSPTRLLFSQSHYKRQLIAKSSPNHLWHLHLIIISRK